MANPSTAHEPSMEEILASIRQIISEDGEASSAGRYDPKLAVSEEPNASVEEDDDAMAPRDHYTSAQSSARNEDISEEDEPMKSFGTDGPTRSGPMSSTSAYSPAESSRRTDFAPANPPRTPPEPPRANRDSHDRALLSDNTDTAVSGAFSVLAHTILAQNARTLEDLVAEMLRPMLKDWLDENLPSLVERLVKEEIERVSRGRR
jgi:cell pole-organizing protein PopZ